MEQFQRFRHAFLVRLILSHLLPIPFGIVIWLLARQFTNSLPENAIMLGELASISLGFTLAVVVYLTITRPLAKIYRHIHEIADNNLVYRTEQKLFGIFGTMATNLNIVSDKLQQFLSSSQTETAVAAAEASQLRSVVNSINHVVLALDKDQRIVLFNKAASRLTGFSHQEAVGKPAHHILPLLRDDQLVLADWLKRNQAAATAEQTWQGLRLKTKHGQEQLVDVEALHQNADINGIRTLITLSSKAVAQKQGSPVRAAIPTAKLHASGHRIS